MRYEAEIREDSPLDYHDWKKGDRIVVVFCETYERYHYIFEYLEGDFYIVDNHSWSLSFMLSKGWPMIGWQKLLQD